MYKVVQAPITCMYVGMPINAKLQRPLVRNTPRMSQRLRIRMRLQSRALFCTPVTHRCRCSLILEASRCSLVRPWKAPRSYAVASGRRAGVKLGSVVVMLRSSRVKHAKNLASRLLCLGSTRTCAHLCTQTILSPGRRLDSTARSIIIDFRHTTQPRSGRA